MFALVNLNGRVHEPNVVWQQTFVILRGLRVMSDERDGSHVYVGANGPKVKIRDAVSVFLFNGLLYCILQLRGYLFIEQDIARGLQENPRPSAN